MVKFLKLSFSFIYLFLIYNILFTVNVKYNEGFNIDTLDRKIQGTDQEINLNHRIEKQELDLILNQPFYYLSKGAQAYVFISEDGRYVIKLFKGQHYSFGSWVSWLNDIPYIREFFEESIQRKQKRRSDSFISYRIAYNLIPEETGVLFLQIDDSSHGLIDKGQSITVTDHFNEQYIVDLYDTNFIIQYTADMVWPRIESEMRVSQEEEAKKLVSRMVKHVFRRCSKGVANLDVAFGQNHGYIDDRAILVDVGCLVEKNFMKDFDLLRQEVYKSLRKFRIWIERFYPELLEHFYSEIDEQLKEYDPNYFQQKKDQPSSADKSGV